MKKLAMAIRFQAKCFRRKPNENGWATFENRVQDFPQRIIYTPKGVDMLYARIEGKERASEYVMVKKQIDDDLTSLFLLLSSLKNRPARHCSKQF